MSPSAAVAVPAANTTFEVLVRGGVDGPHLAGPCVPAGERRILAAGELTCAACLAALPLEDPHAALDDLVRWRRHWLDALAAAGGPALASAAALDGLLAATVAGWVTPPAVRAAIRHACARPGEVLAELARRTYTLVAVSDIPSLPPGPPAGPEREAWAAFRRATRYGARLADANAAWGAELDELCGAAVDGPWHAVGFRSEWGLWTSWRPGPRRTIAAALAVEPGGRIGFAPAGLAGLMATLEPMSFADLGAVGAPSAELAVTLAALWAPDGPAPSADVADAICERRS